MDEATTTLAESIRPHLRGQDAMQEACKYQPRVLPYMCTKENVLPGTHDASKYKVNVASYVIAQLIVSKSFLRVHDLPVTTLFQVDKSSFQVRQVSEVWRFDVLPGTRRGRKTLRTLSKTYW